jgi:hypothetical protein
MVSSLLSIKKAAFAVIGASGYVQGCEKSLRMKKPPFFKRTGDFLPL